MLQKKARRKALGSKMEGLKQYYTKELIAQYDCEVENAKSNFFQAIEKCNIFAATAHPILRAAIKTIQEHLAAH